MLFRSMKSVLSSKVNEKKFIVVDDIKVDEFKTKNIVAMLEALNTKKAVIVLDDVDDKVMKSAANLKNVKTAFVKVDDASVSATISVYDILKYDTIVIAKKAVENIEEVYA